MGLLFKTMIPVLSQSQIVAKGFEDSKKDHLQNESPICLRESLRVIISLSVQQKWSLHATDIKTTKIYLEISMLSHLRRQKQTLFGNLIYVYTDLMMHNVFGMIV